MALSLTRAGGSILALQMTIVKTVFGIPVHWTRHLLAHFATFLLQCLIAAGACPRNLAPKEELKKKDAYIEGLHTELDRVKSNAEAERVEKERQRYLRAKALKKLERARVQCEHLQRDAEDAHIEGQRTRIQLTSGPTYKKTSFATHVMLWSAVFFSAAFYNILPSLQLKLLMSILGPVIVIYILVPTKTRHSWSTVVVQCTSAAILGFLLHCFLSGAC